MFTTTQREYLAGSLGNLLPLSAAINSSLQNYGFDNKKAVKYDQDGKVVRSGYENGSYSERRVSTYEEWTAETIKERGLELLEFLETRWKISLGSEEDKIKLLHLEFLGETNTELS